MKRLRISIVLTVVAALASVAVASASYPKPPTGAWALGPGSGFNLASGKGSQRGKVILSNLHAKLGSECASAPEEKTMKVLGTYPLRQFRRGGYTAWGVGKDIGGEPGYTSAQVVLGGEAVQGSFYLLWDYSNPKRILGGGVKAGSCSVEFTSGKPK